ncbi:hypothetical protein [Streptomyces cucumeris]|uniref:hypothetical protein n=1 Tax=Streptomyces cucumeris TaxID=2962890 RepID=UPI003D751ECC
MQLLMREVPALALGVTGETRKTADHLVSSTERLLEREHSLFELAMRCRALLTLIESPGGLTAVTSPADT